MNEHSVRFETVKSYYDKGLWGMTAVKNAVIRAWITVEEFTEITGEPYEVIE